MALTEIEQLLIDGLDVFGVRAGISAAIFLMLENSTQKMKLVEYMAGHPKATQDELWNQAREIAAEAE